MEDMVLRMRAWKRGALVAALSAAVVACGGNGRPAEGRAPAPSRPGPVLPRESAPVVPPAPQPAPVAGALPSLAPLVESVKAAVVNVEVRSRGSSQMNDAARELWERFFG